MSEYVVTDTELTAVANAIRTKGGTSADLEWNADFISAINAISGGGGGSEKIKFAKIWTKSTGGNNASLYARQFEIDGDEVVALGDEPIEIPFGWFYYDHLEYYDVFDLLRVSYSPPNWTVKAVPEKNVFDMTALTVTEGGSTIKSWSYQTSVNYGFFDSEQGIGGAKNILKGTDAPTANIGSDGDVYLQYYNDDIEIPTGYTRLTNIVADGRQYIDSNVIPTYNTKLEFDMIVPKYVAPSASFLFGTRSGLTFESTTGNNQNANSFMLQIGSEKATINKMEHFFERIKVTYDKTGIVIKDKNGTVLQSASMNALSGTATNSMYIFCLRGYAGSTNIKGTIYRVKIYESDVLIRDYIPTSRDSDNVCGLYDVQNDTFTPSASSTPFISGSQFEQNEISETYCKVNGAWQELIGTDIDDVNTEGGGGVLSGESAPSASLGSDGDLYVQKIDLPDDVNFVEYLQAHGTEYIDTDIYLTSETDIYAKLKHTSSDSAVLGVRQGSWSSFQKSLFLNDSNINANFFKITDSMAGTSGTAISLTSNEVYEVKTHTHKRGSVYTFEPVIKTTSVNIKNNQASFTSDYKFRVFGYGGTSPSIAISAIIYRLTIYESGVPVADYLPCLDANNVPCMWDNIAKEYVYNGGTGTFAYGNTVTPTKISDVLYEKKNGAWVYVGDVDDVNTVE